MTLKECYDAFGGSYEDAKSRLMSDSLISRMLVRFQEDKSYENLTKAMAEGNDQDAFRMAHTLKGVCGNLGFQKLYKSSGLLTESLRNGRAPEADGYYAQVSKDYREICEAISIYSSSSK